ncbi:MAG TPA: NAD(P)/FAD-dependent oxidoreductase [Polyangiaceae bacterium]|nr:NAD(P)/FAD-dependent oxidoreductase [Polyangiaceae bacterium]
MIGAGMSGLAMAVRLKQSGVAFTVLEKNADVGGTWFENTYPGCRVDSPNHSYSYSFEANHDWPLYYSTQDVLLGYFKRVSERRELRSHIRFGTEVEEAVWDEAAGLWRVRVRTADGASETLLANALISAVGQLNRPKFPDIPGRERFAGEAFHSARWNHDYDLQGKRVAVIGTGASAFQFVPEIAGRVRELLLFQRTAPWVMPTPNYTDPVPEGMKWLLQHVPNYERWYRFWLFWLSADGLRPYVTADADWQGSPRAIGANNDMLRKMLIGYMRMQIGDKPELLAASIPDYPPGGKRMLRDNVRLISQPITAIEEHSLRTQDGVTHEVDAIIYGTGFAASDFLEPLRVVGRDGRALSEHWDGDARAYLGMTIPSFPNLFVMYGPNTNIVVNGSIIFFSECATHYIAGCLELLLRSGQRSLEVKREPHDSFNHRVDAENTRMAWGAPQVSSWYKNKKGRVSQNWPFPLIDYWSATRAPDPDDYELR